MSGIRCGGIAVAVVLSFNAAIAARMFDEWQPPDQGEVRQAQVGHSAAAESSVQRQRLATAVTEVLNSREFLHLRDDRVGWWEALSKWLVNLVRRIADVLGELPAWAWWLVLIWLVLALVAILAHLVYTILGLFGSRGRAGAATGFETEQLGALYGIRDLSFDSVYARALELLSARDWGGATRYLYVAAILWLDRSGHIAFRLSKTNADYVREIAADANRSPGLVRLTQQFEAVVYGGVMPSADYCQEMSGTMEALRREDAVDKPR